MTPDIIYHSITTLLYVLIFLFCILLAAKRKERGFKVFVIASGLLLLSQSFTYTKSIFLWNMTSYTYAAGMLAILVAIIVLFIDTPSK